MSFKIVRNDITKMETDAIVNAANRLLREGGGVCGAIFAAAGAEDLHKACYKLAPIKLGEAVITPGFKLPAKYIIHTAGPVYKGGDQGEGEYLRSCYINSLKVASENKCESIAIPLISSGIYAYPKEEALQIAVSAIHEFLDENDMEVTLVVFDDKAFQLSKELIGDVQAFINESYAKKFFPRSLNRMIEETDDIQEFRHEQELSGMPRFKEATETVRDEEEIVLENAVEKMSSLKEKLIDADEAFSQTLLKLIDEKGMTDVQVYRKANIDRRLFSKIRSNTGYMPGKRTAIALAIALELNIEETQDLLKRAGFALSDSQHFDIIIRYFINKRKFDIFEINQVLFKFDQPLLGC